MIRYQEIAFVAYPVTDMGLFREVGVSNGSLNERLVAADSHPGIASSSPGLRGTSYPGKSCKPRLNPNGVVAALDTLGHNSDGVGSHWHGVPRVARKLAILGFVSRNPFGIVVPFRWPEEIRSARKAYFAALRSALRDWIPAVRASSR